MSECRKKVIDNVFSFSVGVIYFLKLYPNYFKNMDPDLRAKKSFPTLLKNEEPSKKFLWLILQLYSHGLI